MQQPGSARLLLTLAAGALAAACTGDITGQQENDPPPDSPAPTGRPRTPTGPNPSMEPARPGACTTTPAPARVRRLSHREYQQTVRDLVGVSLAVEAFPVDTRPSDGTGFDTEAGVLRVSAALLDSYLESARLAADGADKRRFLSAACQAPAATDQRACATAFVDTFGRRAFRRPLTAEEQARYLAHYEASVAAGAGFEPSIRFVLRGFLGSPQFLHRAEVGAGTRLGPWEVASALSYFLWGSMPDDALFAEAEAGRLNTAEQVRAQVRRLVADARGKTQLKHFFAEWFLLDELTEKTSKDTKLYPMFDDALKLAMRRETELFVEAAVAKGRGGFEALLLDPTGYPNKALAAVYGLGGTFGADATRASLPPGERAGVLTQASFLATHAYQDSSSPVHRGIFVRRHLLCGTIPEPPPGISNDAVKPVPALTTRDRFVEHAKNPACAACHDLIDPLGYTFESYDAIGRHRTTENGRPVDVRGRIQGTTATDGDVEGALQLSQKLARSADVAACAGRKMFRFALGRAETTGDACALTTIGDRFYGSGGDLLELVAAVAESEAFVARIQEVVR